MASLKNVSHFNTSRINRQKRKKCLKESSNKKENSGLNSNIITELDESEMLCLSNSTRCLSYEFSQSDACSTFSGHYDTIKSNKFSSDEERRKYRNSNDLRNNIHKPDYVIDGICFKQIRGERCVDSTCTYGHEFRMPKKLRLCNHWKNGFCSEEKICCYIHSDYPCRFHYLGLIDFKHDTRKCRYYHGGPLSKESEEMFLDSINLEHFPTAKEMYFNQKEKLKSSAYRRLRINDNLQKHFRSHRKSNYRQKNEIFKHPPIAKLRECLSNEFTSEHQYPQSSDDELHIDESILGEEETA